MKDVTELVTRRRGACPRRRVPAEAPARRGACPPRRLPGQYAQRAFTRRGACPGRPGPADQRGAQPVRPTQPQLTPRPLQPHPPRTLESHNRNDVTSWRLYPHQCHIVAVVRRGQRGVGTTCVTRGAPELSAGIHGRQQTPPRGAMGAAPPRRCELAVVLTTAMGLCGRPDYHEGTPCGCGIKLGRLPGRRRLI